MKLAGRAPCAVWGGFTIVVVPLEPEHAMRNRPRICMSGAFPLSFNGYDDQLPFAPLS